MILARRLAFAVLPSLTLVSLADAPRLVPTRASPKFKQVEVVAQADETPVVVEETITTEEPSAPQPLPSELAPTPMPTRRVVVNPPSRVIQGPIVRRVIPSRYARPFNRGYYRYEPKLGDIRNLPRELTLPGSEGERETLYSLPPRDRGYFVLPRW